MARVLYVACLALLSVAVVYSQTKYCCIPDQFESVNFIEDGRVTEGTQKPTFTEGVEYITVDAINHKIASRSQLQSGGFNISVQIIQLFDKKIQYVIESGECKQSPLDAWVPKCIPDGSTLLKATYYGVGDSKLDIDTYELTDGVNKYYMTVTHKDCVPVSVANTGSQAGVSAMSIKTYTNITMGIVDPSVFNVPAICNNATKVGKMAVPHKAGYPL